MDANLFSSTRMHSFLKCHNSIPIHASQSKHPPIHQSCRVRAVAHQVLDEMPLSDTIAWNNLILSHLTNADPVGALSIYLHMLLRGGRPDSRTLPRVLTASRLSGNLYLGEQIHGQALKLGFSSDQYVVTALIEMYGRLDSINAAKWLLDKSARNNSVSWTILARLYLTMNKPDLAVDTFYQMREFNALIDRVALATAIASCGMLKSVQQGRNIHEIARNCGLEFDILVSNSLLKMYIDSKAIADARAIFDQMPTKDIISWTEIVGGYVKMGQFNEALKLFRQMNLVGIKADSLTISSVLPACARPAAHKQGKEIHAYLLRNGTALNLMVQNAVMDMYVKSGFIESASKLFAQMKNRDVISWTVMILGFSLHGQGEIGIELFSRLEKDPSVQVDHFAYAAVLHCCTTACMVQEAKLHFNCIKEPNATHYALMVALLARAALFDEARDFIDKHQIGRHGEVLRALLKGCCIHQQAKIGKQAIEQLCELEPLNAENYDLLSNWYAANEKWELVTKLKETIKDMGFKPKKAYSWIEFRNKVHAFGTGDLSHPRSDGIYKELQCLIMKLELEAKRPASFLSLYDVEEERDCIQIAHSEMLALGFGLISKRAGATIRVSKTHRVCRSCHDSVKLISKIVEREIIIKDSNCFHHFKDGICSCRDFW